MSHAVSEGGTRAERWSLGYGQVGSSLLLIFPLFLAYELGLLFTPASNGVDFASRLIFDAANRDAQTYLFIHLGMGAVFLLVLVFLWQRGTLALHRTWPVLLESSIYALTLGSFILFVMDRLLGLQLLAVGAGLGNALVVSLGAGVHEELVFRLGMMGLGGVILSRLTGSRGPAVLVAALASAFAFAFAHHVGAAGESFEMSVFVYRSIAGLAFSAIFYYRSLAHAVYSHFLYDLYVLAVT